MTDETVLGIDIGTSATKAILARPDGTIVAQAHVPHTVTVPRPGWAEHGADEIWWNDVLAVCAELAPIAGTGLRSICVSGIGPCLLPCGIALDPLRPAILYGIDTRAAEEIDELNERFGKANIIDRGGSALSSQAVGPKLLWLRRHEPEVWSRLRRWYMANSFVVGRLTGAYVLDHHSASQCNPLYDLESSAWTQDWTNEVAPGLSMPQLVWPADRVGEVTASAADETGLPAGTPVVAGTIDAWAEAFSAGVRQAGDLMLMYGSTMFFVELVAQAAREPLLWTTAGVEPGSRTLAAGMSTAGLLSEWVRSLAGNPSWEKLVREAGSVRPGSDGAILVPYFAGERTPIYDPDARGVIVGLTLTHTRAHLLRMTYEGIAYGARQIIALFRATTAGPRRIVAVGGGTRSDLWLQIVSDVTGARQQVPQTTTGAAYGSALLAAIGAGLVGRETDWATIARTIEPTEETRDTYDELYELYLALYRETRHTSHRLSKLVRRQRPIMNSGSSRLLSQ